MAAQKQAFQAEVKQLLQLVVHSLYSNKEIFLRELISNASDAADKLRFMALSDSTLLAEDADLKIQIDINHDEKTLTVRDNGIGMTADEMANLLGTIAKSGTRELLSQLTADQKKNSQLIGQFGVGFYSSFIVANKVVVRSRKAGLKAEEAAEWSSDGEGEFTLSPISKADRGTEVILYIKDDEQEFMEPFRIRGLVTRYSDHIPIPVMMKKDQSEEYELVNHATAIWTLPKSEVKETECFEFYKQMAHDFEDPLSWSLNRVEGRQEYITMLFIPARAPFDLFQANTQRGLKLYVQRVFILDDAEQFLPHYLRFVRGLIDSNDLPLNVSREILQGNKVVEGMKSGIVKRVLSMLEDMANDNEKYQKFWNEFGAVLKEGPAEDYANKEKVAKLFRFASTHLDTPEQTVSLDDYILRMKPGQQHIYYVTGESFNGVKHSPHLEMFRKKGIEVLLLSDRIDEWWVAHLSEYAQKALHSVVKGDIDLKEVGEATDPNEETAQKEQEENFKDLVQRIQDNLKDQVEQVRVSHRLTDSASCVVVGENALSPQLERLLKSAGQAVPPSKPILEVNPGHKLLQRLKDESDVARFTDFCHLIFEEALLAEGSPLPDPMGFVKRVNALL